MTTWISRSLLVLGLLWSLGACDEIDPDGTLRAGLTPPSDAALPAVPLRQAQMMRGVVTLVPPDGYCIDPVSLSQSFALMARCDALNAATGGSGAPRGVMTVSFARTNGDAALPSAAQVATFARLAPPQQLRQSARSIIFRTSGAAPSADLSMTHWRSVTQLGPVMMGAALFGPEGRRAISEEGADMLQEMITRTASKSAAG